MSVTKQVNFVLPKENQMHDLYVDSGIYAGRWQVDTQLLHTTKGIFIPYNEKMTLIEAYHKILTDRALVDAGLQLAPFSVLMAGIQHDRSFYKKLLGTYQLTGSGTVEQNDKYLLGTPRITEDNGLQFNELRNDEPIARIQPQSGEVKRLDKTTSWGTDIDSRIESEKVKQSTYMYNAIGAKFVGLVVGSGGDVGADAGRLPLVGVFGRGARLTRKLE